MISAILLVMKYKKLFALSDQSGCVFTLLCITCSL